MDDTSPPEIDITPDFANIETVSDQQSAADFQSWTIRPKEAHAHLDTSRPLIRTTKRNIFIAHTGDQRTFTAPPMSKAPESKPV